MPVHYELLIAPDDSLHKPVLSFLFGLSVCLTSPQIKPKTKFMSEFVYDKTREGSSGRKIKRSCQIFPLSFAFIFKVTSNKYFYEYLERNVKSEIEVKCCDRRFLHEEEERKNPDKEFLDGEAKKFMQASRFSGELKVQRPGDSPIGWQMAT